MRINIIAAVARNRAIGKDNKLIYWLPNDLKRFKALTTGHTIIMGRNTYMSLPKGALPNRRNVVLSRTVSNLPGCDCYASLAEALARWPQREAFPLVTVCDDAAFCAASPSNWLWTTFSRSDPATDTYGAHGRTHARHWSCEAPLILDARLKPFHAPPLEEDPQTVRRVEALAGPGGPLHGLLG